MKTEIEVEELVVLKAKAKMYEEVEKTDKQDRYERRIIRGLFIME